MDGNDSNANSGPAESNDPTDPLNDPSFRKFLEEVLGESWRLVYDADVYIRATGQLRQAVPPETSLADINLPKQIVSALACDRNQRGEPETAYRTIGDAMAASDSALTAKSNFGDFRLKQLNRTLLQLGYRRNSKRF